VGDRDEGDGSEKKVSMKCIFLNVAILCFLSLPVGHGGEPPHSN
jgi:hypothetical protein